MKDKYLVYQHMDMSMFLILHV